VHHSGRKKTKDEMCFSADSLFVLLGTSTFARDFYLSRRTVLQHHIDRLYVIACTGNQVSAAVIGVRAPSAFYWQGKRSFVFSGGLTEPSFAVCA
jgi:hypothetical protein